MEVQLIGTNKAMWTVGDDSIVGRIEVSQKLLVFAGKHGVQVQELIDAARDAGREPEAEESKFTIRVRRLEDPGEEARVFDLPDPRDAFRKALESPPGAPGLIYWNDAARLAMLDVDYHHCAPPDRATARRLLLSLRPRPFASWISHGGGLHALYEARDGLTAKQWASCAAISIKSLHPQCGVEVLTVTNHPAVPRIKGDVEERCSDVVFEEQNLDGALVQWRGGGEEAVSQDDINEWLDLRGMTLGARHAHTDCPFDPSDRVGDSVVTNDDGVVCFRCKNTGHESKGFATWAQLIGGRVVPRIVECARALVPWEHAQHVIAEDYGSRVQPGIMEEAYLALAAVIHGPDDPRLPKLRQRYGCVRGEGGMWLAADTLNPILPRVDRGRLAEMPSTRVAWKKDGEWQQRIDGTLLDMHATNQSVPGWPELIAVRGLQVWGQYLPYGDRGKVRAKILAGPNPARYVEERRPLEDCEAAIEAAFPKIDLRYLRLLIAARGFAEAGVGMVPMIVVSGPSGSGKTKTVELAATILGDEAPRVPPGDFQETLGYKVREGGLIVLDEFSKNLGRDGERERFDFLLQIDRDLSYRRLYVGPTKEPIYSAIIVTNNVFGEGLYEHSQVGRRCVYVPLVSSVPDESDWQKTCGTGDLRRWRRDPENAKLADEYASHIIDLYFSDPRAAERGEMSFFDTAKEIGFSRLKDSVSSDTFEGMTSEDQIRDFFKLVCQLPDAEGDLGKRGWAELDLTSHGEPALEAWKALCVDFNTRAGQGTSMVIGEKDLAQVLGTPEPVSFFSRVQGGKLYLKFQVGNRKSYKTNGGIL